VIAPPPSNPATSSGKNGLDETKRRRILALLTNGSSRRAAARHVGCHPASITRLAARDPEFAHQMSAAQQTIEVECLHAIRKAATQNDQWRAAVWLLQHKYRDDFGSKRPDTFTLSQLFDLLTDVAHKLLRSVPLEDHQATACCLDKFIEATRLEVAARYAPPAQPVAHVLRELAIPDIDLKDAPDDNSSDDP